MHELPSEDGSTTMVDRITFSAPFGVIGSVAERILLRPYLRHLIRKRNLYLVSASSGLP